MRRLRIPIVAMVLTLCVMGCASIYKSPNADYLKALSSFNQVATTYLEQYDMMPGEVQAEWEMEIEPYFELASEALDAWGLALAAGEDAIDKQNAYLLLRRELLRLLIKFGAVEVK